MGWFSPKSNEILLLRQDVDTLKREVRNLQLDWTDYEQRLRRRVASLSRQTERLAELEVPGNEDALAGGGNGQANTALTGPAGSSLTLRQQKLQAQILDRRARLTRKEE